jgi:hypothetical protein
MIFLGSLRHAFPSLPLYPRVFAKEHEVKGSYLKLPLSFIKNTGHLNGTDETEPEITKNP